MSKKKPIATFSFRYAVEFKAKEFKRVWEYMWLGRTVYRQISTGDLWMRLDNKLYLLGNGCVMA
jgi:hypothetical protein